MTETPEMHYALLALIDFARSRSAQFSGGANA